MKQQVTPPFFSAGDAGDVYTFNRDDPSRADVREHCEALWLRYAPYCGDAHFLSAARKEFHARTWEMTLACALLDHGFALERPPGDGPDIKVVGPAGPVWIEATIVEEGEGDDRAEVIKTWESEDGNAFGFHTQPDKIALRYTNALFAKRKQLDAFRTRGVMKPGEVYVVAINGALIDDFSSDEADPEILKAVYPIGEAFLRITLYDAAPPEAGHHHRPSVAKVSGTEIPTNAFLTDDYAGISGLLYSRTRAWQPNPRCRDGMLLIHNRHAETLVPTGLFSFGREALVDDVEIRWHKHPRVLD